jgi:lipoprotein NlpI
LKNRRLTAKARLHLVTALELNAKSAEAFNLAGVLAEVQNYEPAQQNMRRLFEVDHFGSSEEPVNLGDN